MAPLLASDHLDVAHVEEVKLQRLHGGYTSIYFASVIAFIILIFGVAHWLRRLNHRLHLWSTSYGKVISTWSTTTLNRSLHGVQVLGVDVLSERVVLAIVYFGLNIGVSVWGIDWNHYTTFANRLGWVSLCNMVLTIFLGIKNTPLSPIAGRSYESNNVLHRWCGYTTILTTIVHTAAYVPGLFNTGYVHLLIIPGTIGADVAGVAMIFILLTANPWVRRRHYESFYVTHIILIMATLITVCYHTSKAARHAFYIALVAASIYILDRTLRLSRFLYYLPSNTATLTPLRSSNATRVTLTRSMPHAAPGSHAFLYIPSLRALQSHPFTMISRDPVEFVISARDGFTKDLFEAACEKPGRKVRAGLEGAYGHVPAIMGYERVVLFAGGSGATFTFALAVEWAKKQDVEAMKSLEFVWSVRTAAQLEGFTAEIAILEAHPRINIRVHITKPTKALSEKPASLSSVDETSETAVLDTEAVKIEATAEVASLDEILPLYTVPGRPDVYSTVHRIASECQARERILVAACGPAGLSDSVRDAVKSCTSVDGPSLDLHLEAFGW